MVKKKGLLFFFYHCSVDIHEMCRVDAPRPAVRAVNNFTASSVYVNNPEHLLVEIL